MNRRNQILTGVLVLQLIVLAVVFWPRGSKVQAGQALFPGVQADQIVATLVISERVPVGFRSAVAHDHFSLLWSIESAWGLPCLNLSCSANTFSEFFPGP